MADTNSKLALKELLKLIPYFKEQYYIYISYITNKHVLHNMCVILTKDNWETLKKLLIQLYCTHEKKRTITVLQNASIGFEGIESSLTTLSNHRLNKSHY